MTPEQKNKVITLRDRFVKRRENAMSDWIFCEDIAAKAAKNVRKAADEWHELDVLVNAPDTTLLIIAEATR